MRRVLTTIVAVVLTAALLAAPSGAVAGPGGPASASAEKKSSTKESSQRKRRAKGLRSCSTRRTNASCQTRVGDIWFISSRSNHRTVRLRRNRKIRFLWRGRLSHNVTVLRGPQRFRSSTKTKGSYTRKFSRRGTYTLYCTVHGRSAQSMKVRVR